MTIGGPSGPGGSPVRPAPAGGAIRQFLEQGPLEGRVTADLGPGGMRVATAFGLLTVTEAALPFLPGDLVRLRLDPRTGRVRAEPPSPERARPPGAPVEEAAPPPAEPVPLPRTPALSSAVLASLQPLVPGHGALAGADLPTGLPLDSPAFALLAALFPDALPNRGRDRAARPLRRQALRAYHPEEAGDLPRPDTPERPPETEPPEILDAAEIVDLRWQAPATAPDPVLEGELTEDEPGSRAGLEITLADGARLRFEAKLLRDRVRLDLRSDHPLPEGLAVRLRARAERLAQMHGLPLDLALDGPAAPQP